MVWEVFKREDVFEGRDKPFVSIGASHFTFNAAFVRMARTGSDRYVTVHVDCENRRVGFEFHAEERPNSFALSQRTLGKGRGKGESWTCSTFALLKKLPWLKSVASLSQKGRRFTPRKENNLWVIQLCPAFEEQRARESADIPSGLTGIYRYVRESGEIVYIGRGDIKKRLASPERVEWDFDRVEYSLVADPDQQVKWETHWLDRHKQENSGRLPFYNKVSGAASAEEQSPRAGQGTGGEQKNDSGR
jgi:hypothetical protein